MPPRAWLERRPRMAKKIVISLSVCVLWACFGRFYPCSSTKKALFSRRFSPWPEMQGACSRDGWSTRFGPRKEWGEEEVARVYKCERVIGFRV